MKEGEEEGQAEMEEWKWGLGGGQDPGWTRLQCWFLDLAHPPAGYTSSLPQFRGRRPPSLCGL